MKRIVTLILCAFLLFTMSISVNAQDNTDGANTKSEAEILNAMANSWIDTCEKNIALCDDGMTIYSLGQICLFDEDMIREVYKPLKDGLIDAVKGSENVQIQLKLDDLGDAFCDKATGDILKNYVNDYCKTKGAEFGTDEYELNVTSKLGVDEIIKKGEIIEEVTPVDVIKENYAFALGKASCQEALDCFRDAKKPMILR